MEHIKVIYKITPKSKKIRITVKADGSVVVTRPKYVSEKKAVKFFKEHEEWIIKTVENMSKREVKKLEYNDGNLVYFLGNEYYLKISEVNLLNKINQKENFIYKKTQKSIVVLDNANNNLEIYIKDKYNDKSYLEKELLSFLSEQAKKNIEERLAIYTDKMDLEYNEFKIKDVKTKWGSCSSKKNLNFNYRLIHTPQWVLDYVVVHELAHLKHMDHSKSFWQLVEVYAPKYKEARKWLKENTSKFNT